jgi:dipeptidase D
LTQTIKNLGNPSEFWDYFEQISQIPRCSGNEAGIRNFIKEEAEKFDFDTKIDKTGNLVVRISPNIVRDQNKKVVLQSHLDIVCEKNEATKHDFSKDPLKLKIIEVDTEKWLSAEGTTLGADNGVGIAYSLALMKKIHEKQVNLDSLAIDLLFTVEEETGLYGALGIDKDMIEGDYLINLDSESDEKFTIGCAGGINTLADIKLNYENINDTFKDPIFMKISVGGLNGGHSGIEIDKGRGNSIKILSKILWKSNKKYSISLQSIRGGNKLNAIPREAQSIIIIEKEREPVIRTFMNEVISEIKLEIGRNEPNLQINLDLINDINENRILARELKDKLLDILYIFPNGPISMHQEIQGLVHTSTNLAAIKMKENVIQIGSSQRSVNAFSQKFIEERIEALFNLADLDITVEQSAGYPGWDPNFNSTLLKISKDTYNELFINEAKVKAIHAGLECGVLKKLVPNTEMISLGPNVIGGHTPDERLQVKSVTKIWTFLLRLLEKLQ